MTKQGTLSRNRRRTSQVWLFPQNLRREALGERTFHLLFDFPRPEGSNPGRSEDPAACSLRPRQGLFHLCEEGTEVLPEDCRLNTGRFLRAAPVSTFAHATKVSEKGPGDAKQTKSKHVMCRIPKTCRTQPHLYSSQGVEELSCSFPEREWLVGEARQLHVTVLSGLSWLLICWACDKSWGEDRCFRKAAVTLEHTMSPTLRVPA